MAQQQLTCHVDACNQTQSDAIGRNQTQSDAISSPATWTHAATLAAHDDALGRLS